jgi:hypothetical protein
LRMLPDAAGRQALVEVSDDGAGMTGDVQRRCMEPFFTTQTRKISTGLGLALVRGAVHAAGGSIEIESRVDEGTTFRLRLPLAPMAAGLRSRSGHTSVACIAIADRRLHAYVSSILRGLGVELHPDPWSSTMRADLLVLDTINGCADELDRYLREGPSHRAVVFQSLATPSKNRQIVCLEGQATPVRIRQAIHQVLRNEPSTQNEVLQT